MDEGSISPRKNDKKKNIFEHQMSKEEVKHPVQSVLVRRIAKFNGPTPSTREQFGAVFHQGYFYMFGGATQQSFNDLRRYDPESSEWMQIG